ncbi:hypothetical protein YM304_35240 [Ilumatobacter coccineus YM16-304]|uniref:Uncharacterized protein n=1 Tax=Ilumatobacter coccineus (strain NBRC 103263 / KCTC 29153 / YM16-304) TaxID=1313172 RepID=A0A6C7EGW9_ILUCY|nr:hypothetical protein YM304_35240 [Ilumatobacter coccineus YM16-304]
MISAQAKSRRDRMISAQAKSRRDRMIFAQAKCRRESPKAKELRRRPTRRSDESNPSRAAASPGVSPEKE